MKIISGFLKGRKLNDYQIEGTRPTMDRVKESIFASIQSKIKNSIVLDLFAGSGNYGIEAISNYAKLVYFNDKNIECIKVIKKSLNEFKIVDKAIVYNFDYLKCLKVLVTKQVKFDLIFLDPPYKMEVIEDILKFILKNKLLNKDGLIICEYQEKLAEISGLELIKIKKYGNKLVNIYKEL